MIKGNVAMSINSSQDPKLEDRKKLFFKYVWDHTSDSFYASFDTPPKRRESLLSKAVVLVEQIDLPEDELISLLTKLVDDDGRPDIEFLAYVIQIAGYTRSKIVSDLNAKKLGEKLSSFEYLISKRGKFQPHPSWKEAVAMLILRLRKILKHLATDDIRDRLRALDLATYPGYIRQERAKYIGHYAEKLLAEVLDHLGIPFIPKEKKENPLYGDVVLGGESFDLIIPDDKEPIIAVKSTIHTSNTGQYGESKDKLEIEKAHNVLKNLGKNLGKEIILVALADGIGYKSNKEALEGLFMYADEVVQFATLWKIPTMAVNKLGLGRLAIEFYGAATEQVKDFEEFLNKWEAKVIANSTTSCKGARTAEIENIAKLCIL